MKKKVKVIKTLTKEQELQKLVVECNKALGVAGAIYLGSEAAPFVRHRTGILALDYVLGGGLVEGQMIQFTGSDSSSKTTAALVSAATMQKEDLDARVLWLAGEGFDKGWARKWGVDLSRLLIITGATGDTMLESGMSVLESGLISLAVLDSFQSLGTERELNDGIDSESYAGAGSPQMWGRVQRRFYSAMNRRKEANAAPCMIGISQVRSVIGKFSAHGPPEPEGINVMALKHWKGAEVYFRKGELYAEGENEHKKILGREFKVKCPKNKLAVPEKRASFSMYYDAPRIDNLSTLVRLASAYEIIERKGAWFKTGQLSAQGEEKFIALLETRPKLTARLEREVLELTNQ